jgi:hypothetical protein
MNWNDPSARADLLEQIGPQAYATQQQLAREAAVMKRVNGHAILPVMTRFGELYAVGDTHRAFSTLSAAEAFAKEQPK